MKEKKNKQTKQKQQQQQKTDQAPKKTYEKKIEKYNRINQYIHPRQQSIIARTVGDVEPAPLPLGGGHVARPLE